jgi:hypothetical protein
VPAGVAAGDRSLPVPAVVAFGVLESLGVVEEPDGVVAAVVEIGARAGSRLATRSSGAAQTSARWTKLKSATQERMLRRRAINDASSRARKSRSSAAMWSTELVLGERKGGAMVEIDRKFSAGLVPRENPRGGEGRWNSWVRGAVQFQRPAYMKTWMVIKAGPV